MSYSPHVGDYRTSKPHMVEKKYFVWRFETDGHWEFVSAMDETQAGDFLAEKTWLDEDEQYIYWRLRNYNHAQLGRSERTSTAIYASHGYVY